MSLNERLRAERDAYRSIAEQHAVSLQRADAEIIALRAERDSAVETLGPCAKCPEPPWKHGEHGFRDHAYLSLDRASDQDLCRATIATLRDERDEALAAMSADAADVALALAVTRRERDMAVAHWDEAIAHWEDRERKLDAERATVAALRAALVEIRNGRMPQVCAEFELCQHVGCAASYAAFAIADAALAAPDPSAPYRAIVEAAREVVIRFEDNDDPKDWPGCIHELARCVKEVERAPR